MTGQGVVPGGRLLARNTGLNVLGQALPLVVAAAAMPAAVRALGAQRFGILGLAWMAISYLGEIGFGRATTRYVAAALGRGDMEGLNSAAWGSALAQLAIGLLCAVVLAAAAPAIADDVLRVPAAVRPDAVASFRVLAAGIPVLVLSSALRGILEAAQRFGAVNAVRVPASAANYAGPLVGALFGFSVAGIVAMLMCVRALCLLVYLVLSLRTFPVLRRPRIRLAHMPELIRFGNWTTVSSMTAPLLVYMDRGLLGAAAGVTAVGYYTPSFELVLRMLILPVAVTGTLFPALSTLTGRAERERAGELVARCTKYVLLLIGPAALLLALGAHDLLRLWLGPEYEAQAAGALQLLALGVFLNASAHISFALLNGAGRADLPGKVYLAEVPLYALFAWLLIREWGIPGAALAWTVRSALDAFVLAWLAGRQLPETRPAVRAARVPQTVMLVLVAGVAGVALAAAVPGAWARGAVMAAALALTTLFLWRRSFSEEERSQLHALLPLGRGR
jgi:O-antigen/teichoic acid export membrane protein